MKKINRKTKIFFAVIITLALIIFAYKEKYLMASNTKETNTYNLYITDAPCAYQQVNVNIVAASVYSDNGGWTALTVRQRTVDLLKLSNGKDTLLASGIVAPGIVSRIKLTLSGTGNTVTVNGTQYPLQLDTPYETVTIMKTYSKINKGQSQKAIIDFDAGCSVYPLNSGYALKPVIRYISDSASGGINGSIAPVGTPVRIVIFSRILGRDSITTFPSNATSEFCFQGLAPGSYFIKIVPQPPFAVRTFNDIRVTNGNMIELGTITMRNYQ